MGVHDGDTVTLLTDARVEYKIRLGGIDAPELGQAFGKRSKENLAQMIYGKVVSVSYDKVDKYGRLVGKISMDGQDINLRQVQDGMAWHYKHYQEEQPPDDKVSYSAAETEARNAGRGLWIDPNPLPPWKRRHPGISN